MISFLILESRCRVSHSKRKESPDSREFIPTATGERDCIRARRHLCPGVGMAPGREVEYRPDSGAPFAHLQWNKNRLRALPTSWKALGQSGNTQGSPASFPGHAPWLPARWSGSSRRDTSQRVGTCKSDIGPGKKNCRYGRKHSRLRTALWE